MKHASTGASSQEWQVHTSRALRQGRWSKRQTKMAGLLARHSKQELIQLRPIEEGARPVQKQAGILTSRSKTGYLLAQRSGSLLILS
jgi:hypothetical protein